MRRVAVGAVSVWLVIVYPANAQFVGNLAFTPKNCDNDGGVCTLVHDFGFIDPSGVGWQAKAGLKTDGASIPGWAQPLIGGQFDSAFIKAAVIHDHYCVRHVRSFLETHRVFYDALIASGVDAVKANTMYYAVLVGGPKWIELISGEPCKVGSFCVQKVGDRLNVLEGKVMRGEGGDRYVWRDPIYSRPDIQDEIREGARIIEQQGLRNPSEALKLAKERRPSDPFLNARAAAVYEEVSPQTK
jgi:hypothetical protein